MAIYTDNTALLDESSSALSWYVIKPKTPIPNEERQTTMAIQTQLVVSLVKNICGTILCMDKFGV
jgi:hypothetical protein